MIVVLCWPALGNHSVSTQDSKHRTSTGISDVLMNADLRMFLSIEVSCRSGALRRLCREDVSQHVDEWAQRWKFEAQLYHKELDQ